MSHLSLFVSGTHKAAIWLSFKMSTFGVIWNVYKNVDFIDVHLMSLTSLRPEGPSVSKNVHEVWSWSCFIDDFDVTSRHVTSHHILRRRLVSTLWTRPHVMSIDRSQSHHRKQMWCQMLINLQWKISIRSKTRSKLV